MAKKAHVNKELCISCGTCISLCEQCFKFDENQKSTFLEDCDVNCCDLEAVADSCPTAAIDIIEE